METVEKKVSDAILESPITVQAGERTFEFPRPTAATLILVSEEISKFPKLTFHDDKVLKDVLANAKDCKPLGRIAAILILGAKKIKEGPVKYPFWKKRSDSEMSLNELSEYLLYNSTIEEINTIIQKGLGRLDIGVFFSITTFLNEINLLKVTKETTQSGQS